MFIEQVMVIGENEKFASAIIAPDFAYIRVWLQQKGIAESDMQKIVEDQDVLSAIQKDVREINKTLGQFEEIKRFRVVADVWSPGSGELSPTLKLKRNVLAQKYSGIIQEIYSTSKTSDSNGLRINIPRINLSFAELITKLRNGIENNQSGK